MRDYRQPGPRSVLALWVGGLWAAGSFVTLGCQGAAHRPSVSPVSIPLPPRVTGANLRPVQDERRGYGTATARRTMERLCVLGVNTIGVLIEGRMSDANDTTVRLPSKRELESVHDALIDAGSLQLATVLIPHIYLDDGTWRGEIKFEEPDRNEAWWTSYARFIDAAASVAATSGATALSIGVELKAMSKRADTRQKMLALAAAVRRDYRGLLTYSANWDEAEAVGFWDAVDIAGVNGYYPLTPEPVRGAEAVGRRLTDLAKQSGRDVLVLEVGYRSSPLSHVRPWEWPSQVPVIVDDAAQANAWAAVLTHWLGASGVRGLLAWVVPTDPDDPASEPRHGFSPLNKPAEEVLSRAFLQPDRSISTGSSDSAQVSE